MESDGLVTVGYHMLVRMVRVGYGRLRLDYHTGSIAGCTFVEISRNGVCVERGRVGHRLVLVTRELLNLLACKCAKLCKYHHLYALCEKKTNK